MTIDLSEFERLTPKRGPRCPVGVALKGLAPAKRAKLKEALARTETTSSQKRIVSSSIMKWLAQEGHDMRRESVDRHRRGECSCDRSK